jgi:hypothetical protein
MRVISTRYDKRMKGERPNYGWIMEEELGK